MSLHRLLSIMQRAAHANTFGDSVPITYTPPDGGTPQPLTAIVGAEQREEKQEGDRTLVKLIRSVLVSIAELAAPSIRGTCTVDGQQYSIRGIRKMENGQHELELSRPEVTELTRQQYRR